MNGVDLSPVNVYQAQDPLQAHMLCNHLEDHGVAAYVTGSNANEGSLDFHQAMLWVAPGELEQARSILQQWEEATRKQNKTSSTSVGSFQLSLAAVLVNITLCCCAFAYMAIVKDAWNFLFSIFIMIGMGNLCYIGLVRRKHERRLQGKLEDSQDEPMR